ncbi:ERF family protein [Selenomonas ruminantium]|uniref:ERF family protein n=1 Tax=Selenomonas ruminantium TaxID=971 RepID=UPI0026F308F4|nr:ERF family protein [Selenomonas ruminantium]
MEGKAIYAALQAVQRDLKAPKGQYNSFGKYKYRSCEDIVEAVKPLLNDQGLILTMSDEVIGVADRVYIKATCKVIDVATGDCIETTALARESLTKKGMDDSQITGTASSYARKYALNGLFAIDDTKDADTDAYKQQTSGSQTSQNRPQGAARQNATTNTHSAQQAANGGADAIRTKAIKSLNAEISRMGLTGQEVSAIAGLKFNKVSTKDMTTNEICQLTNNLETWVFEQTGATA